MNVSRIKTEDFIHRGGVHRRPRLHLRIRPRRRHVSPVAIHRQAPHGSSMRQHLHQRVSHVGRPQRDGAVRVAQVHDGVVRVLAHGVATAELGPKLRHDGAVRGILIPQHALFTDGGEEKVVG